MDNPIRTIAHAVAAANAVVVDEHLAIRGAAQGIGRAILHAVRMFAMPTGCRYMYVGESRPGFAVKSRRAAVGFRASLLAIVATNAQRFVDEQDIGRFTGTLGHQERDDVAATRHCLHGQVGRRAFLELFLQAQLERRNLVDRALERGTVETNCLGRDRGACTRRTMRLTHQRHLADIVASGDIGQHDFLATDVARNRQ